MKTLLNTSHSHGKSAEHRMADMLRNMGLDVIGPWDKRKDAPRYDLMCEGKRIEVKSARESNYAGDTTTVWRVNLHRHGILDESPVDYYAIEIFSGGPYCHFLIPAPVGVKCIQFSQRQLCGKHGTFRWGAYLNNFQPLFDARNSLEAIGQK